VKPRTACDGGALSSMPWIRGPELTLSPQEIDCLPRWSRTRGCHQTPCKYVPSAASARSRGASRPPPSGSGEKQFLCQIVRTFRPRGFTLQSRRKSHAINLNRSAVQSAIVSPAGRSLPFFKGIVETCAFFDRLSTCFLRGLRRILGSGQTAVQNRDRQGMLHLIGVVPSVLALFLGCPPDGLVEANDPNKGLAS